MPPAPYSPQHELLDRLERVRVLLAHALEVRRLIAGGEGGPGARALERFLGENIEPGFVARPPGVEAALAAIDTHVAERAAGRETPFTRLVALLGLTPLDIDLLLCAIAPGVRRGFREAMLLLGPEVVPGGVHPAAHLVELCADSAESYARARAAVGDDGVLIASGALLANPMSAVAPPLWRAIAPAPSLRRWLEGSASAYPRLDDEPPIRRATDRDVSARIDAVVTEARRRDVPVRVVMIGRSGSGRTRAAAALAHRLGTGALVPPRAADELRPALLDARLRGQLVVADIARAGGAGSEDGHDRGDGEGAAGSGGAGGMSPGALAALLAASPVGAGTACAVLCAPGSRAASTLLRAGFARIDIEAPSLASQVDAWVEALGAGGGASSEAGAAHPETVDREAIADVVRGHSLPFHAIEQAAGQALLEASAAAARAGAGSGKNLVMAAEHAASAFTGDRLAKIADRLSTTLTWDDLILPDDVRVAVDEVWQAAASRRRVYEDWGFGTRTPYGRAISALFTGEPGTGKTMVATLVARQLGVELYRVDLSRLVDKYIGETEKHLALLFDEAERGRCVLLFDEADSLFGKRTKSGESATERYANLEINYLLQRIETFSGIVVLTTNQESIMDDAFKRRLRYRVVFPFPDDDERTRLWRRLLAPEAPLASDVDPDLLGRRYRLSGGHIKNAVLRAAFAAAAADCPISHAHLVHAANQELENIGKLVLH